MTIDLAELAPSARDLDHARGLAAIPSTAARVAENAGRKASIIGSMLGAYAAAGDVAGVRTTVQTLIAEAIATSERLIALGEDQGAA